MSGNRSFNQNTEIVCFLVIFGGIFSPPIRDYLFFCNYVDVIVTNYRNEMLFIDYLLSFYKYYNTLGY